jgi:hypothetical protein
VVAEDNSKGEETADAEEQDSDADEAETKSKQSKMGGRKKKRR